MKADISLLRAREIALGTGYALPKGFAAVIVRRIAAELRKCREQIEETEQQLDFMCSEADAWERAAKAAEERADSLASALHEAPPPRDRVLTLIDPGIPGLTPRKWKLRIP